MLTSLRDFFRRYNKITFAIVAFLVGAVFTVISIITFGQQSKAKVEVTATIVSIEVEPSIDEDGSDTHTVYVSYTDEAGNKHENVIYPGYSQDMKAGDQVQAFYLEENPNELVDTRTLTPIIFLVVGIASVCLGVFLIVKTLKTSKKDANDFDKVKASDYSEADVQKVLNDDQPENEYYFHFTGKLNQSFILETKEKTPVFEARCDKMGIVSKSKFTFVDSASGRETEHEISHTVSSSYNDYVDSSYFKIDGVKCWDHLAKLGYSLEPGMKDITHFTYDVKRYGVKVGVIESAGGNVLKEGKQTEKNLMSVRGIYIVRCKKTDIEGFFTACFILSRVEVAY